MGPAGTPPATLPRTNSPDAASPSLTPLVVIAILVLLLHVATGIMLDRSHIRPADAGLDDAIELPAVTPPQPLPYD
jgi:hypothetical protein